jgi:hypothetical protein
MAKPFPIMLSLLHPETRRDKTDSDAILQKNFFSSKNQIILPVDYAVDEFFKFEGSQLLSSINKPSPESLNSSLPQHFESKITSQYKFKSYFFNTAPVLPVVLGGNGVLICVFYSGSVCLISLDTLSLLSAFSAHKGLVSSAKSFPI